MARPWEKSFDESGTPWKKSFDNVVESTSNTIENVANEFPKITESVQDASTRIMAESHDKFPGSSRGAKSRRNAYQQSNRIEDKYQRILEARGSAAQQRSKEARDMSFLEKLTMAMGREGDKLYEGTAEIGTTIAGMTGLMDEEASFQANRDRADMQANANEKFLEIDKELGMANIGGVLPYMATGVSAGPTLSKLVGSAISGAGRGVSAAGKTGGGIIESMFEKGAVIDNPLGKIIGQIKKESFDPKKRAFSRLAARAPVRNPYRKDMVNTLLGDTVLGAAEGAAHYDNNIIEGAGASIAGTAVGMGLRPLLSKMPDTRNDATKELVDWGLDQGYRFGPGLHTGSQSQQAFERGLRSNPKYADTLKSYNDANTEAVNRITYKAMGIIPDTPIPKDATARKLFMEDINKTVKGTTPQGLQNHLDDLKKTYKDLESSTKGQFGPKDIVTISNTYRRLKKSKFPDDVKVGKAMEEVAGKLKTLYKPYDPVKERLQPVDLSKPRQSRRERRENRTIREYDGEFYDDLREYVTDKIKGAGNNRLMSREMGKVRDMLDDSIKRGMGPEKLKEWTKAREQRKLTNMVIENGMVLHDGSIDLRKLGNSMLNTDAKSVLTESGEGGLKDLQKLVKIKSLEDDQFGGIFSSDQLTGDRTKQSPFHGFINSGFSKALPVLPSAYVGAYMAGYPSRTGLLGMNSTLGKSLWEIPGMTRALDQGLQYHPSAVEGIMDAGNNAYDSVTGLPQDVYDMWRSEGDK